MLARDCCMVGVAEAEGPLLGWRLTVGNDPWETLKGPASGRCRARNAPGRPYPKGRHRSRHPKTCVLAR